MQQGTVARRAAPRGATPTSSFTRPFAPATSPALSSPAGSAVGNGHELASVAVSGGAPLQRNKKVKAKAQAKAEERMGRWQDRSEGRKEDERLPTGRYETLTGPVTVSNLFKQRMTQARKEDYGDESLGSVPDYAEVMKNLPDKALKSAMLGGKVPGKLTNKEKLATSLASTLTHVSEEDREPGYGKFARALTRKYLEDGSEHPFDPTVNPAVGKGGAKRMRDVLSGKTPLTKSQREAIDKYASDSSDEDEKYYGLRKKLFTVK